MIKQEKKVCHEKGDSVMDVQESALRSLKFRCCVCAEPVVSVFAKDLVDTSRWLFRFRCPVCSWSFRFHAYVNLLLYNMERCKSLLLEIELKMAYVSRKVFNSWPIGYCPGCGGVLAFNVDVNYYDKHGHTLKSAKYGARRVTVRCMLCGVTASKKFDQKTSVTRNDLVALKPKMEANLRRRLMRTIVDA